jgi:tetratricopeptide (TPR) repeat protein
MRTTILFTLLLITLSVSAQRPLLYNDISKEGEKYPMGKNTFARVTVSAVKNLHPYFSYANGTALNPTVIDTLDDKVYYHLHINVTQENERQTLEVNAKGFSPCNIPLFLGRNKWLRYHIYDPDATIVDCYNQLMREGLNLFTNGMYEEARAKYNAVQGCTEIGDIKKVDEQIAVIDSIQQWRMMADAAFARSKYADAIKDCQKILEKNPKDEYNRNRLTEARTQLRDDCGAVFRMAQTYFEEKDFGSAKPLYEQVIEKSCNESTLAYEKLREIRSKKQLPHALTYEYSDKVPIGISTGNYKEHKVSGYFTLRFNSELFELLRTDIDDKALYRPELNVSFGWTVKIVKPVWIFFGPGYTGVGQYLASDEKEKITGDVDLNLKIKHAVSPEAGLAGKVNIGDHIGLVLRYTFQYRYALEKDATEYIGKTRHVLGVGFCF